MRLVIRINLSRISEKPTGTHGKGRDGGCGYHMIRAAANASTQDNSHGRP